MTQWQRLLVSGPFEIQTGRGGTLHARPTGSEVPIAFHVESVKSPPSIKIQFRYSADNDEPRTSLAVGNVSVMIGEHSRRLFEMQMRSVRGATASSLAEALLAVTRQLTSKTPLAGPQVNYQAVNRGLDLDPHFAETPAWMASALDRLRDSDPLRSR